MSQLRYLFLACSIAFFACTNDVAGTWEDENTLANKESSSSVATISSSDSNPLLEILWIDSTESEVYMGCVANIKIEYKGELTAMSDTAASKPAAIKGTFAANAPEAEKKESSTITLNKFIEGRITKLVASGIPESEADSIAQWELFKAIGIDSYLQAHPNTNLKAINSTINYIFGGTTNSDSYKNVNTAFTETGTLQQEHYCSNFDEHAVVSTWFVDLSDNDDYYNLKGCSYNPRPILDNNVIKDVLYKCLNLPHCDSTIKDTVIKTSHIDIGDNAFICKDNGWERATDMEAETYGIPCDKKGKYIVHSKQPEYSYMCRPDSGWYGVRTIDAETADILCDSAGMLYASPNRPNVTYICKKPHNSEGSMIGVCNAYPIDPDPYRPYARCRKEDWEIAKLVDVETANIKCDSEGNTYQSPSDTNLYYVCHDGKWTEFYNMPCDTDNMRVKIINDSLKTNFAEYICFNKTWRRTYKMDMNYPKEYYFNPNFEYGEFEDARDGQIYRTTEFKGKTWMAENIKYNGVPVKEENTACLADSCQNVGRFYTAEIAGEICPEGWRLPDSSDIASLGTKQEDIEKLYSQLEGIGINTINTAPDTYGMSFMEIGRICETDNFNNFVQEYATRLWLNETDSDGNRRFATITTENINIGWYQQPTFIQDSTGTKRLQYSDDSSDSYRTIRCIKK
ncbi:MAG: hypothetical protein IKS96_09300 [Fibrobacter sp.]|nr:hypothetical protein [Fibrobacter sp.]